MLNICVTNIRNVNIWKIPNYISAIIDLNVMFYLSLAMIPIHHMEAHALTARLTEPVS